MNKRAIQISTFALLLSNFMGGLDSTIINTALPAIMNDLNGIEELGLLTSIFLFFLAITTVLWGKIAEKIGGKTSFQISTFIFVISSLIGGFSTNIWFLIIARGVMGLGAGGMISIPFIIYAQMYTDSHERAKALGWVTASFGISTILGPVIGGWLVDILSWHWTLFINFPIGLFSILLIHFFYQDVTERTTPKPIDVKGAALLIAFLTLILYTINYSSGLDVGVIAVLIALIFALAVTFWNVEKRAVDPIVPNELIKDFHYMAKNVMMILFYGFSIGYTVYAPMWAQSIMGTNATVGGATQILSSIAVIIATRLAPSLLNKVAYKVIVWIGFASVIISAFILAFAPFGASYWTIVISGGFMGFGQGLAFPPLQVVMQNEVRPQLLNIATTFSLLLRTLGQTMMASVYGMLLTREIVNGARESKGTITLSMVNGLSADSAGKFAAGLLTQMREILFSGIHIIFVVGLVLVVLGFILNKFGWKHIEEMADN